MHPAWQALILQQMERELAALVLRKNREQQRSIETSMSITGANYLGQTVRDRVTAAKAKIAQTHERMTGAMDELDRSTAHVEKVAAAIEKEAADLTATAAQFTNGPPE
jgi:hypothetical protein